MVKAAAACLAALLLAALPLASQNAASLNDGAAHGDPRYLLEDGWTPLLNGRDMGGWHALDGKPLQWFTAKGIGWNGESLFATPAPGGRILNGPAGRTSNLVSDAKFGDVELYVEFLIPKNSNSGVYLHGLYEIQVKDSFGTAQPTSHDCGGVYERIVKGKGQGGTAPLRNAARPAGQWQSFEIWFRGPRFDPEGRKTQDARFLRVLHNGLLVQENVTVDGPTNSAMKIPEAPTNPLMLQGDHGPVAYRNIFIRPLRPFAGK
ncbi:MAG: DUF1080 domain-containing protein [Acidobacteria bacterium]|nr:DUF1080 domain-containing protein [Acidobacteriota bacterium]MCL5744963.1 DUF1080 domain-containing protein [Acidobacteriota bacterium]